MNTDYKNEDVCVSIYVLAVVLMTIKAMLERLIYIPKLAIVDNLLIAGAIGLFLVVFVFERTHTLRQWILVAVFGMLCVYSSLKMQQYYFLTSYFLILASIGRDTDLAIRVMNWTKWVIVSISVTWYLFALAFGNTIYTIQRNGRLAHHFGFTHPNNFAMIVCWLILESTYLHYEQIQIKKLLIYPILGVLLFALTCCDTAMYILMLAAVFIYMDKRNGRMRKLLAWFSAYAFLVFALANMVCIWIYTKGEGEAFKVVFLLDKILTARIRQASLIYSKFGCTVFGQYVPIGKSVEFDMFYRMSTIELDGLYSNLFLCNGIVYTVLFSIIIWLYIKRHQKNLVFIALFCIYSVLETHGLNIYIIFPLLLVCQDFFVYKKET